MRLTYRDRSEGDDDLFDRPLIDQQRYMAQCLNFHPSVDFWDFKIIDKMLAVRRWEGRKAFYRELGRMMSPH